MTTTDWQKIFLLSTVNGADNYQEMLPSNGWQFPRETWLQRRLKELKQEQNDEQR
jgi:hypothetical protein